MSCASPEVTALQPEMSRKSSSISTGMDTSAELDDELVAAIADRLAERVDRRHDAALAVRVRLARERQWSAVAQQRRGPMPARTDAVAYLDAAAVDLEPRGESVELARHHRVDADRGAAQPQTEQTLADESHRDSRAARVHAPAALHADGAAAHRLVTRRGVVAIGKFRVRARCVAIGLAQPRVRHRGAQAHRVGPAKRLEEGVGVPEMGHRLRVAQMGVGVEQSDLPAEEGARLGALKALPEAAVVRQRAIEEPGAVGREQTASDLRDVSLRLLAREEVGEDPVDHRQQAPVDAGVAVGRMQPRIYAAVVDRKSTRLNSSH